MRFRMCAIALLSVTSTCAWGDRVEVDLSGPGWRLQHDKDASWEPGGYVTGGRDAFAQAISRQKLLRMVKRDRSHPSLIIYNMINEQWVQFGANQDDALFAIHQEDLRKAHKLDPSRIITYTSAWCEAGKEEPAKLHLRPFDDRPYFIGWQDYHRAMGPETWLQSDYTSPTRHVGYETNRAEIVFRGEEGAIGTPPRLEKTHADLQKLPRPGWDGAVYERWYDEFASFLDHKQLRGAFPSVDALTCAMGARIRARSCRHRIFDGSSGSSTAGCRSGSAETWRGTSLNP